MLQKEIETSLGQFRDGYLASDWLTAKVVKAVQVLDDEVQLDLVFAYPAQRVESDIIIALNQHLAPLINSKTLRVNITYQIQAHAGKPGIPGMPNIKNIIAVASGKGGVGKSTVAINLALALVQEGARVGLLDADIYGPSQPMMLGAVGEKPVIKDRTIAPIIRHGLQAMSIGFLVDGQAAMVWRGPMLGKALEQLMNDTLWQDLDYLIVDLPPGTGDVQLTLCQKMPVSGAVIVTTPQDLALLDVTRACEMFNKLSVPILGVVENMSVYHCPQCGHAEAIFGAGGGAKLAEQYELSLLGQIPLSLRIRELTDNGLAPVLQEPDSHYAQEFGKIARLAAAKLALRPKDYSAKFPKIVVK